MVGVGQMVVSLKAQLFLGYWGLGESGCLENQLNHLLSHLELTQSVYQQCHSFPQTGVIWGVAGEGLKPEAVPVNTGSAEVLLTLSGSGVKPDSPDSLFPADAWIRLGEQSLCLGREPFGRSPLYWLQIGQVVWFASSLRLLLPLLEHPQISIPAVYGYSCFSYVPTPLTPVSQLWAIPAGGEQTWRCHAAGLTEPAWARSLEWQEAPVQIQDETVAIDHLQTRLKDAVHRQIADLGNEPVGVFLSGGVDSSIVAALLVQAGIQVRAYTLDFGDLIPEHPYAQMVADFLKIPLIRVNATPRVIRRALLPTVQALDLPFGDGVTIPLFLLGQAACQEVQVVFNGEGGDQLFAGWTNKPLIAAGVYAREDPLGREFADQYLHTFHRLWGYERQIFQPEIYTQVSQLHPQEWISEALQPAFSTSLLHRLRRATLMLKGAQNIQPRAVSLGQAHGLQVRSPFCDLPLATLAFQLSGELYLQGACEKYILKRAVESWLPLEIVWRTKRGMGVPLTSWCLHDLWHDLGVWLNPERLRQEGIWQPDIAARIVAGGLGTLQGRRMGESLWLLLIWQVWRNAVLGVSHPRSTLDHPFWLPPWLGQAFLRLHRNLEPW